MLTSHARLGGLPGLRAPEQAGGLALVSQPLVDPWQAPAALSSFARLDRYLDESMSRSQGRLRVAESGTRLVVPACRTGLGDVVMALPLIRAVREARPDAEITLVASCGDAAFARAS